MQWLSSVDSGSTRYGKLNLSCPFVQAHEAFYESLFALECRPRCLQHQCRSTLRKHFGKDCHRLVPRLPIPKSLQSYLLLEPEGILC